VLECRIYVRQTFQNKLLHTILPNDKKYPSTPKITINSSLSDKLAPNICMKYWTKEWILFIANNMIMIKVTSNIDPFNRVLFEM